MVKMKHNSDAENMNRNTDNGSHMKTSKPLSTNRGRPPKRTSMEDKSSKNDGVLIQQGGIKDATIKKSPLSSSPRRGKTAKVDDETISETATSDTKNVSIISEVKVEVENGSATVPDVKKEMATPSSAVRRSGRAPVPSSRYKDMELDRSRSKKRFHSAIEESEVELEQVKKSRKTSDKPAADIDNVVKKSIHSTSADEPSDMQSVETVVNDGNIPLTINNMTEQNNFNEADFQKESDAIKNITLESVEIQIGDLSEQLSLEQSSSEQAALETGGDMSPTFPNIKIGGQHQQLTFTERDGETVAVVTISSASSLKGEDSQEHKSLDSSTQDQGILFEMADPEKGRKTFSDLVTVNPTIHNLGHVVKREMIEAPFATVVGQDGATYLNLSVEATNISSILKGKHVTAAVKSTNPLKGHGRVLRSPVGNMIVKTTLVPPRMSQQQEASEAKPSVTFSLLCPKKPQVEECTYSVPRTVSVMSSQVNQSPQRIVIRQQPSQQSSLATASHAAANKPSENTLTVINFSQELPTNNLKTFSYSTDDSNTPKTASEILLQRLKLQSNLVPVTEPNPTNENRVQEVTLSEDTSYSETCGTENEIQTSQQISSECVELLNISHISHDEVGEIAEKSDCVLPQNIENSSKMIVDSSGDFSVITVQVDTQDDNLSKNITADVLCESVHTTHEEDITTPRVDETPVQNLTESSEEGIVINTSDDITETSTSSSTYSELKNVDLKDMKMNISVDNLAESGSIEQSDVTTIVNLRSNTSSLTATSVSRDNDNFIEKIRVVDNGVEYDVRIVSEEEVAEEIIDNAANQILRNEIKQSDVNTTEVEPEIVIKQEMAEDVEDIKTEVEKQTSGTQTVYSPQVESTTSLAGTSATTTHTLTTVVDEGSEKKHVYYVSVIPNKGIMAKTKTSMYSSAASWVIDDNGMYCCEKCDYQTDRKANFYKHRRSHTGSKPHVCSVCQYKAGTSSNLKRHMGIHKDIREHKCDICSLCFRQKIHLERHIKYKHEEKSIKCPMCDYICANEQPDLKMHIKRKHSTENSGEMVTCPECKTQVGNRKDLKQHMKFHRDGPELKLFCKECSFVTDCQSRLKRHTAIHSKMKPFQCGVCNYRAAQKEHVLRHLRTQHKIDIKRDGKRPWRRHKKTAMDDGSKERADFTSGDKIFACNHCTMRFAKLINLYKHLHTQHGDIMPTETDGNFYCVVCEFSTTNKKNLLVHMRRHNMTDQTPPTHVYSCVLCRYVNPRRRNLFQHMRKKHNINISRQSDSMDGDDDGEGPEMEVSEIIGSVNRAMTPTNTVSVTTTDISERSSREMSGDLTSVASVIKIEDLTRMTMSGENDDVQALVIDSRGADITEVVHTTAHAADALEGLQALAEQAGLIDNIIEEQVPVLDEQQTVVIEHNGSTTEVVGTVETVGSQLQHIIQSTESLATSSGEAVEGIELSEDQLSSLRNGDMVEMEGHLYLVELSQDPNCSHKQVLSFLPVTTASITQDSQG